MEVRVKKLHKDAVINNYAKEGDAGIDLTAVTKIYDKYGNVMYGTGLAFEIPVGYVGLVFPRSSINKYQLSLANAVAVIDSGYRGEVILKFKPTLAVFEAEGKDAKDNNEFFDVNIPGHVYEAKTDKGFTAVDENGNIIYLREDWDTYNVGDRIAQIIILPHPSVTLVEAEELSETERGEQRFGSSGK